MLNFIYYPISFIMWLWHEVFSFVFGDTSGLAWALSVVFLVVTLRAILYKPFVGQVRSMRKMQQMAPEMQKLRKKYANDKQKLATEMQKLQAENGANPLGGCLPVLVQVPVFIGLFHVLREFKPGKTENYYFGADEVRSFVDSNLLGAKLGGAIFPIQGVPSVTELGGNLLNQWIVMVPLMIAAGIFTHITARHSVARQAEAQAGNPQAAIMNKLMLYVFPIGVVVGAPFLPLAVLFYWVTNNLWTLGQQYVVYKRIDSEESQKREKTAEAAKSLAPKPGQKPVRPQDRKASDVTATNEPETVESDEIDVPETATSNGSSPHGNGANGNGASANGSSANGNGARPSGGQKKPGAKPVKTPGGASGKRPSQGGKSGGSRPGAGKRKRR
ncbi:YidC/Oxa1 family membrane protein insertase [Pseudonocardia sediminis]|uniref:Membrane protein insertase YidC n=1 Tax=Pseudonocardia sediminis TaxID=1397368 RepID=A0A4Q7UNT9_PSEST|nr:membrane protein insertase YidC [Pseudonocardia sediminis]RZT83225.1 YidC/Oxa1 family membrane protein insertase [Pseudonocardia sediminis]